MKLDTQTLCRNTGFFRHSFLFFLSLVTHVLPVCYRSQSLSLTSNFASSSPVFSISFYLPFFALHVCRLIHKLSLCFVVHVVFKNVFFSQMQLAMQFPAKNNAGGSAVGHAISRRKINPGCSTGFECLISSQVTWSSVSTDGRAGGRAVVRTEVTS